MTSTTNTTFRQIKGGDNASFEIAVGDDSAAFAFERDDDEYVDRWFTFVHLGRYDYHLVVEGKGAGRFAITTEARRRGEWFALESKTFAFEGTLNQAMRKAVLLHHCR